MDIMYIEGTTVLHIVDEATRFSAAPFLPNVSTNAIWEALLHCWGTVYTVLPNRILVDQEANSIRARLLFHLLRALILNLSRLVPTPTLVLELVSTAMSP